MYVLLLLLLFHYHYLMLAIPFLNSIAVRRLFKLIILGAPFKPYNKCFKPWFWWLVIPYTPKNCGKGAPFASVRCLPKEKNVAEKLMDSFLEICLDWSWVSLFDCVEFSRVLAAVCRRSKWVGKWHIGCVFLCIDNQNICSWKVGGYFHLKAKSNHVSQEQMEAHSETTANQINIFS